ncbi:MAG: nucleotidyltransferase domain-containing protein [Candidatus Latescibacterota bacterium]
MAGQLMLQRLPETYRQAAGEMAHRLLADYPRTVALVVIGSVARGTHQDDSDLDLVWVHRGKLPRRWRERLGYWGEGTVELVPFTLKQVAAHFRQHSPMAHALRSGVPLYDPRGLHARWQSRRLGLPTPEWIEATYDFTWSRFAWGLDLERRERRLHRSLQHGTDDCSCRVSEVLTRGTLNLVRLLLALAGHVPLCKTHTRQLLPAVIRGRRLRQAAAITLVAHHEKRDLTLPEAAEVAYLGRWTRAKLVAELGVPAADERDRQVRQLMRRTRRRRPRARG